MVNCIIIVLLFKINSKIMVNSIAFNVDNKITTFNMIKDAPHRIGTRTLSELGLGINYLS